MPSMMKGKFLVVNGLSVTYRQKKGKAAFIGPVSFSVCANDRLALLGPSGIGKTTIALAIMGLLPENAKWSGEIIFKGKALASVSDFSAIRGRGIGIVFQQPHSYLNPIMKIGKQLDDVLRFGFPELSKEERIGFVEDYLAYVGLDKKVASKYPFELSGGMVQRTAIAQALLLRPDILIADEITSSLDMSLRRVILDLIIDLQERFGFGLLFISHDISAVDYLQARKVVLSGEGA